MKKLLFVLYMIILGCGHGVMAQSKTTETKASMLKVLRNKLAKGTVEGGASKKNAEKFADCFTKELSEKLNLEELTIFYKLNTAKPAQIKELEKQAIKMGLKEKMKTLGMACASILQ